MGARLRFVFREGEGPTLEGEVREHDPPRPLAYAWGESLLRFDLAPEGEGCRPVLRHRFDDPGEAATFAAGWHLCLDGLADLLAGRPQGPSGERWSELNEGYLARFGASAGAS